jgi:catechol 2,3-dioxygenase
MPARLKLGLEPSHTVVYVRDIDEMVRFYTEVLGFEVTDRGGEGSEQVVFISQGLSHHQLAFVTGRETTGRSNTIDHTAYLSSGTLDDLRALYQLLLADDRVSQIEPKTHGNTWSVYFSDPEGNGVEVYIETPWHVQQPQIEPLDLTLSNEEIEARTRAALAGAPGFSDIADFRRQRAERLAAAE